MQLLPKQHSPGRSGLKATLFRRHVQSSFHIIVIISDLRLVIGVNIGDRTGTVGIILGRASRLQSWIQR